MLKSITISLCIAVLISSCDVRTKDKIADGPTNVTSNKAAADSMAPTTVQVIDSVFDFGKVEDGQVVEFSYRFKNIGQEPLVVANAVASCGCTVPEKPEAPVKPGETGFIKVKFNSEGRVGVAHKTVTVESNARPSFPQLLLKGEVMAKAKQ